MKKRGGNYFELLGFVVFALMMAFGLSYLIRGRQPRLAPVITTRGKDDAALLVSRLNLEVGRVTLIEFMDFECPPCRSTYPTLKLILAKNPSVAYREVSFPLEMHPYAFGAAVALEIARKGGQHDKVFEDLFSGRVDLDPKSLNTYLEKQHLVGRVGKGQSVQAYNEVSKQVELGKSLKISATPTIMVLSKDGILSEIQSLDSIGPLLR